MKRAAVFALIFGFVIARGFAAGDSSNQNNPAPSKGSPAPAPPKTTAHSHAPHVARAVHNPATVTGTARVGNQPYSYYRRNYPSAMQTLHRDLAMNIDRGARTNPSQTTTLPVPDEQIDPNANRRAHHGRTNPQPGKGNNPGANNPNNNHNSYADALKRCRHDRHDSNWWRHHCRTIVFVNTGYYYLDAGYWYPAYGYDPAYTYSDYDGPIYTYGNLLPDQVIANVQLALRDVGYYLGPITGSLGPATRAALANFQRDNGLDITGAVDEWTVQSLGLI